MFYVRTVKLQSSCIACSYIGYYRSGSTRIGGEALGHRFRVSLRRHRCDGMRSSKARYEDMKLQLGDEITLDP